MDIKELLDAFLKQNSFDSDFYVQHRPDFDLINKRFLNSPSLHDLWIHGVELNNIGDINRLYFLYCNILAIVHRDVPGSFAELGVYKGNSAKLFHTLAPNRLLYLLDTFSGFSEQDKCYVPENYSNFDDISLESVKNFIGEDDNIIYCIGRFPETLSMIPDSELFAMVHLDCDLYEPMKEGLEYFYPRMSPGSIIIIHDYYSGCWPGVTKAVDEFLINKRENLVHIPDKSGTAIISINNF